MLVSRQLAISRELTPPEGWKWVLTAGGKANITLASWKADRTPNRGSHSHPDNDKRLHFNEIPKEGWMWGLIREKCYV